MPFNDTGATMSTGEFSRAASVSHRQLQYWDEQGFLKAERILVGASGSGHRRQYRQNQIPVARFINAVGESGTHLRRLLKQSAGALESTSGKRWIALTVCPRRFLMASDDPAEILKVASKYPAVKIVEMRPE